MSESTADSRGKGVVLESESPREIARDISLVNRAWRERWKISEERKLRLVERLFDITEKTSVTALDSSGEQVELEDPADKNAIAAAKVLVAMDTANQREDPAPQLVEHKHTHDLGPVTADNFVEYKRIAAQRIAELGGNS